MKTVNVKKKSIWIRGLAMFIYGFIAGFARVAITFIAIAQFVLVLFTGEKSKGLSEFGYGINCYIYQINQFITFNCDDYPFPMSKFPESRFSDRPY